MPEAIRMANSVQFILSLRRAAKKVPEEHVVLETRKLALLVLKALMRVSPVDTGRFRAEWKIGVNRAPREVFTEPVASGKVKPPTLGQRSSELANLKAGDTVFVSNPLPYAQRLNDGWSSQAPAGFIQLVGLAVLAGRGHLKSMAGEG